MDVERAGPAFDHFGVGSNGNYNSFAVMSLFDGIYGAGGKIEKTTGWGFRGAYVHNWSPNWESSLFGSYTRIDYNNNASDLYCARYAASVVAGTLRANCNPDFAIWQIGTRTAWTPVKNLTFSGEVMYTNLDQAMNGAVVAPANAMGAFKPAGTYNYADQGIWSGNLRVRRTW